MIYSVVDLGGDVVPWALNRNNDVVYQGTVEGQPIQVRLADGALVDLPLEVTRGVGISDNRLVLSDLASGGSGLCHVETGDIEPITIPGLASAFAVAINSYGDVAGSVGAQAFILPRGGAVTLVSPTLPPQLPGATNVIIQFNDLNDQRQAAGVQQWLQDLNQAVQPLWFDGTTLQAIGQPDFIADAALITNDQRIRVWRETSSDAIYEASTHELTLFAGTILDICSGGRVLWQDSFDDGPGYLSMPGYVTPVIDLFPPGSGFSSAVGQRMNENGSIIGLGTKDDGSHGFLLKPDSL
ncbi:MAG TPA: hypothetical protein VGI79_03865 [Caulobacteraceae bacterium]|jgi:hypothetical protein